METIMIATIETTTTPTDTRQAIKTDSKDGKAFLNKVIRECKSSSRRWEVSADTTDPAQWKAIFTCTIKGNTGDPDVDVRVRTDITIRVIQSQFNKVHKEGSGYTDVVVPPVKGLDISYSDVIHFCDCVIAGCSFSIDCSCGSQSSSAHGIVMLGLRAHNHKRGYSVRVGHDTWVVQGDQVCFGSVRVR